MERHASMLYSTFLSVVLNNLLNPVNDLHLFALHYVYVPRINRALAKFHGTAMVFVLNMVELQISYLLKVHLDYTVKKGCYSNNFWVVRTLV